ncbi:MAG: hypothetical protein PHF79_02760 [Candidatus Pacebacteria bacterium]|nr:hypothetical protein [Candidatus Paceibacterota bacterium]
MKEFDINLDVESETLKRIIYWHIRMSHTRSDFGLFPLHQTNLFKQVQLLLVILLKSTDPVARNYIERGLISENQKKRCLDQNLENACREICSLQEKDVEIGLLLHKATRIVFWDFFQELDLTSIQTKRRLSKAA